MCARRFLAVIFVLTLLVVARRVRDLPVGRPGAARAGGAQGPFRGRQGGRRARLCAGVELARAAGRWPTIPRVAARRRRRRRDAARPRSSTSTRRPISRRDRWNAPLDAGGDTEFRTRLFVQSQASAFNGAGEIWAPRYRQAAYGAFLLKSEDAAEGARPRLSRCRRRVRSSSSRRPATGRSSSPGTARARCTSSGCCGRRSPASRSRSGSSRLMSSAGRSARPPTCRRSACPPARAPDQAGCILSWMTFGEPANPDFIFHEWEKTTGFTGGERRREDMLCVNPITGDAERRRAAAGQSRHAGPDRRPAIGDARSRARSARIATRDC